MQPIFVLNIREAHKSYSLNKPLFYFTDSEADKKKVLNYIKNDLETFFDGDSTERKQRFAAFKDFLEFKGGILSDALNSDTSIFASCTELNHIKNL